MAVRDGTALAQEPSGKHVGSNFAVELPQGPIGNENSLAQELAQPVPKHVTFDVVRKVVLETVLNRFGCRQENDRA